MGPAATLDSFRRLRIGFVATRLAGTDGVSLETAKLAAVSRELGHQVFYCAGELDTDGPPGMLASEMHFSHPEACRIHDLAFGASVAPAGLREALVRSAVGLKAKLLDFFRRRQIDLIVVENAFAIPMQIALGVALRDALQESGLPAVAHNHDFYWERERFQVNCIPDILESAFPPDLPNLRHWAINSLAQHDLLARRGIASTVLPNVLDFENPTGGIDDYNRDLRAALDLSPDDCLILQPTRVVPRKGIELAIDLVQQLNVLSPRHHVLVISHPAGDEGFAYLESLQRQAAAAGVDLRYVADRFDSIRGVAADGSKIYSLWDAYPHADFVTYPSLYEGFGNALLEAVYFRRPLLVNRYPVYTADIGPLGFDFVEIAGKVSAGASAQVQAILENPDRRQRMVTHNYRLARQHFSYATLRDNLHELIAELF